ncbi:hypothetical protein EST38_g12969 [Candolleomyces aberdarensis]|uniref:Uncharacterized protein n=1 Tax=Candolleomyces aberdarensis TaxID=2316362 RepID=A0A4Q2D430_9AGAR|nr:hypothetical protein EST38_g12969 [Candolleomyces aberdarensis]
MGSLTCLSSIQIESDAEIGGIKRNNNEAKLILANAVQHVGQSIKIWFADLEQDVKAKKRVLRKVGMKLEGDEGQYDTWVLDAQRGRIGTSRAILTYALKLFPERRDLLRLAADLEKTHGTPSSLDTPLSRAVGHVPYAEVLWLMRAERWMQGDVAGAREVLVKAFDTNSESEQIWLVAENG